MNLDQSTLPEDYSLQGFRRMPREKAGRLRKALDFSKDTEAQGPGIFSGLSQKHKFNMPIPQMLLAQLRIRAVVVFFFGAQVVTQILSISDLVGLKRSLMRTGEEFPFILRLPVFSVMAIFPTAVVFIWFYLRMRAKPGFGVKDMVCVMALVLSFVLSWALFRLAASYSAFRYVLYVIGTVVFLLMCILYFFLLFGFEKPAKLLHRRG